MPNTIGPVIRDITVHGNLDFESALFTQITPGIWMGGTPSDMPDGTLPSLFRSVVNLYPEVKYTWDQSKVKMLSVVMQDALGQVDTEKLELIVGWMEEAERPMLVHCQAGINRSGLVLGQYLINLLWTPQQAIDIMRKQRSPAVLCNPTFEQYLLNQAT